ncbi:lysylphosphatidylglycerol synthase transmembrane domain-containing protein [Dongia deserti]|uniref:lysylphosphatidylglycerol synthase transmembrane domain-containing protein n=1 Tax=Dongia deserti TaxID=2268030 RepID=UPI0013C4EE08|nr:lysylphosphatidylglycerol synthase transmembrane domain-containing protein [Dongia deserti]
MLTQRKPRGGHVLIRLLQAAVSLGLLAALIAIVDWQTMRKAAAALSLGGLIAVFAVCLLAQAAFVLRWRALLDMLGMRESWARSWHSVFAGLFLTNFLPGTLGSDGLRVVLLTKSYGRASTAIGAIAYERLMQLAVYVCLVSVAALLPMPWLQPWLRAIITVGGVGAVLVLIFILYWLGQRSPAIGPSGGGFMQTAWHLFATILTETGRMQTRMRRHRRAALGFWLANILNIALVVTMSQLILLDIGEDIGLPAVAFTVGGGMIIGAAPISINGLGTFESANVALLGLAGVVASHGFVVALVLRAAFILVSIVGLPSAFLLWRERKS